MEIERDLKKRGVGKTVLVVDDNAAIRKKLAAAFLSDGFERCAEAENGKKAIELAERIMPDVIILDFSMPVMNGLEAAPRLRKACSNTPIILFTQYEESLSKTDVSKAGVSLVVPKTGSLSLLLDKAHELMGN